MTDWQELADERGQEIIRLGTLLDDAVDIILAHAAPERGPMLAAHTANFLSHPKIVEIAKALSDAGWQGPKLVCLACGADYAEATDGEGRIREGLLTVEQKAAVYDQVLARSQTTLEQSRARFRYLLDKVRDAPPDAGDELNEQAPILPTRSDCGHVIPEPCPRCASEGQSPKTEP